MNILLGKIDEVVTKYGLEYLNQYSDKRMNNVVKQSEHSVGRFLLALGLKHFYGIEEYKIKIGAKGKPEIDKDIKFNISHSGNYAMVGFSNTEIGIDIEKIKPRDYSKVLKYYGIEKEVTETEFYQLWTDYESRYKSGLKVQSRYYQKDDYIFSVSSADNQIEIYEYIIEDTINIMPADFTELQAPAGISIH